MPMNLKPFDPTTRCQHCGGLRKEPGKRAPNRCPTRLTTTWWKPWPPKSLRGRRKGGPGQAGA
jgi:hypothetical protein